LSGCAGRRDRHVPSSPKISSSNCLISVFRLSSRFSDQTPLRILCDKRTLSLGPLGKAGVDRQPEELVFANLHERVRFDTSETGRVIRVLQADGEMPMVRSGSNGLDDLAGEGNLSFPSALQRAGRPAPSRRVITRCFHDPSL